MNMTFEISTGGLDGPDGAVLDEDLPFVDAACCRRRGQLALADVLRHVALEDLVHCAEQESATWMTRSVERVYAPCPSPVPGLEVLLVRISKGCTRGEQRVVDEVPELVGPVLIVLLALLGRAGLALALADPSGQVAPAPIGPAALALDTPISLIPKFLDRPSSERTHFLVQRTNQRCI